MNRLARLHDLAAKRERLALAALSRDLHAFDSARQRIRELDERASERQGEMDREQEQAWQRFLGDTIDYPKVIEQQTREAAQMLELENMQAQRAEADNVLGQAEQQRRLSLHAYGKARRRLSTLQILDQRQQADVNAQSLAEEDQPLPWKAPH